MIARRLEPAVTRRLSVLLDLSADGGAELVTDAQDSAEHVEALARLRRWCDRRELDALLAALAEEGGRDA